MSVVAVRVITVETSIYRIIMSGELCFFCQKHRLASMAEISFCNAYIFGNEDNAFFTYMMMQVK